MGKVEFENIQFLSGFQTTVDCVPLFLLASKAITLILSSDQSSLIPSRYLGRHARLVPH